MISPQPSVHETSEKGGDMEDEVTEIQELQEEDVDEIKHNEEDDKEDIKTEPEPVVEVTNIPTPEPQGDYANFDDEPVNTIYDLSSLSFNDANLCKMAFENHDAQKLLP